LSSVFSALSVRNRRYRSLDSLRSLGMTEGTLRSLGMMEGTPRSRGTTEFR